MKLDSTIREDFYRFIKASSLMQNLSGSLYKYEEERPMDSSKEDAVIALLTEVPFSDVQEVVVMVRIYVADQSDTDTLTFRADGKRIREIEHICKDVFEVFHTSGSRGSLQSIKTFKVEAKKEHCVVSRILFQYCNY